MAGWTLVLVSLAICQTSFGSNSGDSISSVKVKREVGQSISEKKCIEYGQAVYEYSPQKVDTCGFKVNPLVESGGPAKSREFPHMAIIGYESETEKGKTDWLCGGTLISDEYVLTAAHCLNPRSGQVQKYVRLGDLDIASEDEDALPQTFDIADSIRHPDYHPSKVYNDIALLRLDRKVDFNRYIRPACLPTNDPSGNIAIVTGWGTTSLGGERVNELTKVALPIFSYEDCNKTFASHVSRRLSDGIRQETQICAGPKESTLDLCQGAAGGPLQVYHPSVHCMYTVSGILSFGAGCGIKGMPSVYTRVFAYLNWIESIVWKNA